MSDDRHRDRRSTRAEPDRADDAARTPPSGRPPDAGDAERRPRCSELEQEGDIAADYLEELLDIADLDGDLDMDVEGDRAAVSIVGADLQPAGRAPTARCSTRCRS